MATAPEPRESPTRRQLDPEEKRRAFLLLLPSSSLGEDSGYAQVVSSAGQIQPPPNQDALLEVDDRVIAVAQGRADPYFYDSQLPSGTDVRVYVAPFAQGQALQAARSLETVDATMRRLTAGARAGEPGRHRARRRARRRRRRAAPCARCAASCAGPATWPPRRISRVASRRSATTSWPAWRAATTRCSRRSASRAAPSASSSPTPRTSCATPLSTVQANVELLSRANELPPEERRQLREDLLSQLRELTGLVGDLVELARERPPESDLEPLDLAALVATCVERARHRGGDVTFECSLAPGEVRADRARLERAVTNLLDNARKWSPEGGTVHVTVADGELVVRDEGAGIDDADRPYVFDRFYRSAESRRLPGSGLGLAIVRQVAEMHGGAAWAAPPRNGLGAELHLRLPPLPAAHATSARSTPSPTAS